MAGSDSPISINYDIAEAYEPAGEDAVLTAEAAGQSGVRVGGLLVGLGCLAVLAAAWHLEESYLPLGPSTQIHLPKCFLRESTGYPCLTCGMTRAWAASVRGDFLRGLRANVAGTVMAVACVLAMVGGMGTAIGGVGFYRPVVRPALRLFRGGRWLWTGVGLVVLAWLWNMFWAMSVSR